MAVMYSNALYQRGFAKEGNKVLQALLDAAMEFDNSKMYPGLPRSNFSSWKFVFKRYPPAF